MSRDTVDSVLKSISSLELDNAVSNSYTDVAETIRQTGAPSNNTLLSIILSEIRRGNDEIVKLTNSINNLNESTKSMSDKFVESIESQNIILASMRISETGEQRQYTKSRLGNAENIWYYKGNKLANKHNVVACIILQMMSIVLTHLDIDGVTYPDSVDCGFTMMSTIVRVVSSNPCRGKTIQYKSQISLKDITDQAFDSIYPYIASRESKGMTTLTESVISSMINPITRDVMQTIEYVRERLCLMECVLSPRQIDTLRSIKFPFNVDDKLNWDPNKIRSRSSHPNTQEVLALSSKQKEAYVLARMNANGIIESYEIACSTKK